MWPVLALKERDCCNCAVMAAGAPEGGNAQGALVMPADLREAMGMHGDGWKSIRPSPNDDSIFPIFLRHFKWFSGWLH